MNSKKFDIKLKSPIQGAGESQTCFLLALTEYDDVQRPSSLNRSNRLSG